MIKNLSNESLVSHTHALFEEERRLTLEILNYLREIESRKLHLEMGYPSLFEMCVGEFKCSPACAQRRISAMRLTSEVPEIIPQIENGELSLSVLAQTQSFFLAEKKEDRVYSAEEKLELLKSFEGKSTREVEKVLAEKNPIVRHHERVQAISQTQVKLTMVLTQELKEKLDELRLLMSHVNPSMTYEGLIEVLATQALKKQSAKLSQAKTKSAGALKTSALPDCSEASTEAVISEAPASTANDTLLLPAPEVTPRQSRYIPAKLKRKIRLRDQQCCTYIDPKTKRQCSSKAFLEFDHIKPYALGGKNSEENLRLLCRAHNQHRAQRTFLF